MPMKSPTHPGEIVRKEYLTPLSLDVTEGAKVFGSTADKTVTAWPNPE